MRRNRHMDNNGDADKSKSVTNGLKIVQFKEQPDMFIQKRRLDGSEDLSVHERKRAEKGICTSVVKINSELEDKGRKHKKHKDQEKGHNMRRNRHMDNNGDADKSKSVTNGLKIVHFKEQPDMFIQKRRLDGSEDLSVHERKRVRYWRQA
ncbi:hypothetical protein M0R45_013689 [Rubus argutus]|uniref:Uncharacterized protein n=1 Tax=Rubus argutus TaxID=59490 RepID=A0AAW1XJK0_RUBAR